MSGERNLYWEEFDAVGAEQVRKDLGTARYGEARKKAAREWLAHQSSLQESTDKAAILAEARSAKTVRIFYFIHLLTLL